MFTGEGRAQSAASLRLLVDTFESKMQKISTYSLPLSGSNSPMESPQLPPLPPRSDPSLDSMSSNGSIKETLNVVIPLMNEESIPDNSVDHSPTGNVAPVGLMMSDIPRLKEIRPISDIQVPSDLIQDESFST